MNRLHGYTADTPARFLLGPGLIVANYGVAGERELGATRGDSTFMPGVAYRNIEVNSPGVFRGTRVVDRVEPTLATTLTEMTAENLLLALPGLASAAALATVRVVAQFVGATNGVATAFNLGATNVIAGSEKVYLDTGAGDPVLQAASSYTLTPSTGAIVFAVAPPTGNLTASYAYSTGGSATHDSLTPGDVADSHYLTNVALVATISGRVQPFIAILNNALADGDFTIGLGNNGEGVIPVTFRGYYSPEMTSDPFEIRTPRL